MKKLFQPYHLVTLSPWPLMLSLNIFNLFSSFIMLFLNKEFYFLFINLFVMLLIMFQWWRDIIRESTFQGFHTNKVYYGMKLGMILFIISEVFFFISIFWCYFHMFLSPSIQIGMNWPPKNIQFFDIYSIPLLNTIILLSSGITITWCHYSIIFKKNFQSFISLFITIVLGMLFILFQYYEYNEANFSMADSVFGSIFFMATGFHGFHIMIGTIFLFINLLRIFFNHYSMNHHFGFESAAWYWHFVDVVWLFLYLMFYYWII